MVNDSKNENEIENSRMLESIDNLIYSLKSLEDNVKSLGGKKIEKQEFAENLRMNVEEFRRSYCKWNKFKENLNSFLTHYNEELEDFEQLNPGLEDDIRKTKDAIRLFVENLTIDGILSYHLAWPRRYLYERAYYGELAKSKNGFIYNALKNYNDRNTSDQESLDEQLKEIHQAFAEFYKIIPTSPFLERNKSGEEKSDDLNTRAFKVGCLLLRIFFVEGIAANLLKAWKKYEDLIYFAEEKYRDHYLHLFYDFLLGCVILEGLMPRILHHWKCFTGRHDIDKKEVYVRIMRRWLIASLFHDIGYTAQSLKKVSHEMQKVFFTKVPGFEIEELEFKRKPPSEQVDEFYASLADVLSEDEFSFKHNSSKNTKMSNHNAPVRQATVNLLTDQLLKMNHGVMSALFVLLVSKIDTHELTLCVDTKSKWWEHEQLYNKLKKEREEIIQDIEVAALSIAIHNMRQGDVEGITIDFRSHPIAFLLMLCDDLHEWDREPEWNRVEEIITNVYGLDVYHKIDKSKHLFRKKDDGFETLFNFLYRYMLERKGEPPIEKQIEELIEKIGKSGCEKLFEELINPLKRLKLPQKEDLECMKKKIDKWLKDKSEENIEFKNIKEFDDIKEKIQIIRATLLQSTSDVITFVYIGGGKDKRGRKDDKIKELWERFNKLFVENLSWGPSICILHGYEEDKVKLFFIAEYDPVLKTYKIDENLKPKRRSEYYRNKTEGIFEKIRKDKSLTKDELEIIKEALYLE